MAPPRKTQSKPPQNKPARKASRKSVSAPDQYTKPDLRERIKERVLAGDKGGNPGQWSARKAQLVAAEYEREGGDYKHPRTETQEHLHQWTEEHWQTSDSKPARRDAATTRYLPKEAWEQLSPEAAKSTNRKKIEGSLQGKQFVPNTQAAASARRSATLENSPAKKASKSSRAASANAKTAVGKGGSSAKRASKR